MAKVLQCERNVSGRLQPYVRGKRSVSAIAAVGKPVPFEGSVSLDRAGRSIPRRLRVCRSTRRPDGFAPQARTVRVVKDQRGIALILDALAAPGRLPGERGTGVIRKDQSRGDGERALSGALQRGIPRIRKRTCGQTGA